MVDLTVLNHYSIDISFARRLYNFRAICLPLFDWFCLSRNEFMPMGSAKKTRIHSDAHKTPKCKARNETHLMHPADRHAVCAILESSLLVIWAVVCARFIAFHNSRVNRWSLCLVMEPSNLGAHSAQRTHTHTHRLALSQLATKFVFAVYLRMCGCMCAYLLWCGAKNPPTPEQ